jgi:hypothetical protein
MHIQAINTRHFTVDASPALHALPAPGFLGRPAYFQGTCLP